ncbi:phage distal tail protein, Rcc01695 family [Roseobacter sp. S98]|uniref:phage distal tail protein, Rcc01695 family n=1 Tax=Roseobacter algicola (ex Choi et al. 2025) (nom. illeg.) TaxID=3092138 RepID=UPI0035C743C8
MQFHEVRFPVTLSFGSVGGPERRTDVVTISNGFEERNAPWAHSRRRYDAGVGMRSLDDVETMIAFFEARFGQLYAFRWKDWSDYRSRKPSEDITAADQQIGTGDGAVTAFSLTKTYQSGAHSYVRPITKPVAGTVRVAVDGTELAEGSEYTVDTTSGVITFVAAPASGATVTAGFEFDVPVRFDTDSILTSVASFQAGEVPNVPIVEVRI